MRVAMTNEGQPLHDTLNVGRAKTLNFLRSFHAEDLFMSTYAADRCEPQSYFQARDNRVSPIFRFQSRYQVHSDRYITPLH